LQDVHQSQIWDTFHKVWEPLHWIYGSGIVYEKVTRRDQVLPTFWFADSPKNVSL